MSRIEFSPPGPDTPGYLRRQRKALELFERLEGSPSPQLIDEMVEFLVEFVDVPEDPEEAREALWDASEEQFKQLLGVVTGGDLSDSPLAGQPNSDGT